MNKKLFPLQNKPIKPEGTLRSLYNIKYYYYVNNNTSYSEHLLLKRLFKVSKSTLRLIGISEFGNLQLKVSDSFSMITNFIKISRLLQRAVKKQLQSQSATNTIEKVYSVHGVQAKSQDTELGQPQTKVSVERKQHYRVALAKLKNIGVTRAQRDLARNYILFGHMSAEEYEKKVSAEMYNRSRLHEKLQELAMHKLSMDNSPQLVPPGRYNWQTLKDPTMKAEYSRKLEEQRLAVEATKLVVLEAVDSGTLTLPARYFNYYVELKKLYFDVFISLDDEMKILLEF